MIGLLSTNENAKHAFAIVREFRLDLNDFPEVKERLMKASMRYYLSRFLHKKNGQDDYMSLDRIEDLFTGFKKMLSYLVEDLVHKGKMNEAKGIYLRHKLQAKVREEVREQLDDVVYDPKKDPIPVDIYGPVSQPATDYLQLPEDLKVEMISYEEDVDKLRCLLDEPYIGVDSEWRPALTRFHKTLPALFQISGAKVCYLIDFFRLRDSQYLDEVLTEVFRNPKSIVVGFSFNSDVEQYARKYPKMKFYRYI